MDISKFNQICSEKGISLPALQVLIETIKYPRTCKTKHEFGTGARERGIIMNWATIRTALLKFKYEMDIIELLDNPDGRKVSWKINDNITQEEMNEFVDFIRRNLDGRT